MSCFCNGGKTLAPGSTPDDEDAGMRFLRRAFVKTGADIVCARGPSSLLPSSLLSLFSPTSASSASSLRQLFLRILEPAAAATLSDNSTMPSTTTARPLPLPNSDGGTKSSSLVFSNNMPMTSSSSSSVAREGCTPPPNPRTGELGSSLSLPGLRLPPPSYGRVDHPVTSVFAGNCICTGTCTTENVPGAPVTEIAFMLFARSGGDDPDCGVKGEGETDEEADATEGTGVPGCVREKGVIDRYRVL
ncbi:hypothetical protein EDB83DRAFT_438902 [Lactarius deliciosus]|nr:hypothetical protein EDB83DRAFT_438902 [Lactarius deliciosus]